MDLISSSFDEIGIEGIEIEDHIPLTEKETKGMFIDILPELPPDDGVAKVSFYLDAASDAKEMLSRVREALEELRLFTDLGACEIEESETEETVPKEHEDKLLIQIDPGTAFGTGMHETTQLCIRQLKKYVGNGDRVLDVGTGSGILGITALKLGAGIVLGTDLDENAIAAVGENLEANGISGEAFRVIQGNIIDDRAVQDAAGYEVWDVAVANILADVILLLQQEIAVHLKKGGIWITSGIIDMKEEAVREAFLSNPAFELLETTRQGEWVSFTVRKR